MIQLILPLTIALITQTSSPFKVEEVYKTNDVVWGLCFLSPQEILFSEKQGRLSQMNLKTKKVTPVSGVPLVSPHGQGGLMDVQAHPQFEKTGLIYLTYSVKNNESSWTTRISRARLKDYKLYDLQVLFTADIDSEAGEHFGSRIVFDRKGHIYFGIGDRGQRDLAQSLRHYNGKIIRLREDGSLPKDNPYVGDRSAKPEIFSLGHRNPQGMARHFDTGEIWSNEHGPRGGDEINRIGAGKNYGWPIITYGREYWGPKIGEGTEKVGLEQPFYQFTPSIAPSSLMIYSGKLFRDWKGSFFSSALALQHLNRLAFQGNKIVKEEKLLTDLKERFRYVVEAPDGSIFVTTDSGKILRLS